MKKNVIVFGLISGSIVSAVMIYGMAQCSATNNFENGMWYGYTSMLIAFSFLFVGIKNYRDKYNNGVITFGKAFQTGLYISLIASTMYVATWLVDYYCFIPDFMDKYAAHMLQSAKDKGATVAEIQKQMEGIETYRTMYKNPLFIILLTYMEILPLALVITVISALILKKKQKDNLPEQV